MTVPELETLLRGLLKGEFSSLSLTFNEASAPNYKSVAEAEDDYGETGDWISDAERKKGRAENSCWMLQWYPHTPVGFCVVSASTLEALIDHVAKEES